MDDNILIILTILLLIAAVIVPYAIYKIMKNDSNSRYKKEGRNERIDNVVLKYCELVNSRPRKSSDIPALILARINTLECEDEAKEVIDEITKQTQRNPLSDRKNAIENVGILNFFQHITHQQYMNNEMDEIIKKLQNNTTIL